MGMRMWRMLVVLLGATGVAALAPQLASADQPVTGAITGQVTNALTGGGVAGATVKLYLGSTLITTVQTDANGNYNTGARPFDTYELDFVDDGAGYGDVWYNSEPTQSQATPVTVNSGTGATANQALQPDQVTGQLTDQVTGQPISGVEVELLNETGGNVAQTTTGSGGNYSFSVIPGGTYEVAFNPGKANSNYTSSYYGGTSPTGFTVTPGQTTSGINGQVLSGGVISGTVTNPAHQGISGVEVEATNVITGYSYSVNTGSGGTYELDGLTAGSYQVLFEPANGQGQDYVYQFYPDKSNVAAAQPVSVTAGQTTPGIDASLATGATVSGKVTDAVTHAGLGGVTVFVEFYAGGTRYISADYATTDSTGAWSLTGLPTGIYQVEFSPQFGATYASQYYNDVSGEDPPTPLKLTAGSTTPDIDAALTQGGQITGTVTDGTRPVAGVSVHALDNAGDEFASTVTDSAGHYTLAGLGTSASYRVEFSPPAGSKLAAEFYSSGDTVQAATPVAVTLGQTTPNIDETLPQGGSISGVVTDAATGYPLGGTEVFLFDDAGERIYTNDGIQAEPDGSYDFTNLAPGSYKVEFVAGSGGLGFQYYGDASTLNAATPVSLTAGQAVTNIDAALSQGGTLKGVVTDAASGQGLADVSVSILDAKGNFQGFGFTDTNGDYEVTGLAPGVYYAEFYSSYQNASGTDQPEFFGGTSGLAGAKPVTITAGQTTSGIDIALAPPSAGSPGVSGQSTGTPTMTTPQAPVAVMTQGSHSAPTPPTLSGGSLSGLGKGKPVVKFRLKSGSNGAHKLRSFRVKLPGGLAFVAAQLRSGVKVTGGGKVTEKLTGGQLVVTLGTPSKMVTVSISAPALKVTAQLKAKAARKRSGTLRVIVTVTPVNGTGHMLSFTVKNPA